MYISLLSVKSKTNKLTNFILKSSANGEMRMKGKENERSHNEREELGEGKATTHVEILLKNASSINVFRELERL